MLIDGKKIAQEIYAEVADGVARLPFQPVFCDVLVGESLASRQYVNMKAKIAERLGMKFLHAEFPESITEGGLISEIQRIGATEHLCGLIVQLPLPDRFNRRRVLDAINIKVDVDCLNSKNLDLFYAGKAEVIPPTPGAVLAVLDSVPGVNMGKKFVVIGQGELVGRPVAYLLQARGCAVEVITKDTAHPADITKQADVIITAVGVPGLVTGEWIRPGAVVIDAGTAESEGAVSGDVDFASVEPIAGFVSPVPGGVGPVTVAKLLQNVLLVASRQSSG